MNPIFIMSSERSGSNLLRKMLGMHSELADPPPPHMWRHLTAASPELRAAYEDYEFAPFCRGRRRGDAGAGVPPAMET